MDFAFFAVNFGYSKRDYEELTQTEKAFIVKAWENKLVAEGIRMYNACFSAVYNNLKRKGKKSINPFAKKKVQKADMNVIRNNLSVIKEVERAEGKSWIDAIYAASGMRKPKKEVR